MKRRPLFPWLLALALLLAPAVTWAAPHCSGGSLSLSLPPVTVARSTPVGTLLGSPVSGTAAFACGDFPAGLGTASRFTIQLFNLQASQLVPATLPSPGSSHLNTLTYATGVPGIGLQLTINPAMNGYDAHPGDQANGAYVVGHIPRGGGSLMVNYTAQLIVTGAVRPGVAGGQTLMNYAWQIEGYNASTSLGTRFAMSGGVQVSQSGCTVATRSRNLTVTLPPLAAGALAATGATAGLTPFAIDLDCQPGTAVALTLDTARRAAPAGVVAPAGTAGAAANVGVQVLDGGRQPVSFGTAQPAAAGGENLSVPFYAQYYRLGTPVGAGTVGAAVTFTVSYQ